MRKSIACVVGRTASGKDTLVHLAKKDFPDIEVIVSYTTRPKRSGESYSSHLFITEEEYNSDYKDIVKAAYTEINGFRYFVTKDQIDEILLKEKVPVYIIDPIGICGLRTRYDENEVDIFSIYVDCPKEERQIRFCVRAGLTEPKDDDHSVYNVFYNDTVKEFERRCYAEDNHNNNQFSNFVWNHEYDYYIKNTKTDNEEVLYGRSQALLFLCLSRSKIYIYHKHPSSSKI